jgi:hypothetical protein
MSKIFFTLDDVKWKSDEYQNSYLIKIYDLYLGHFVIFKSDNNM